MSHSGFVTLFAGMLLIPGCLAQSAHPTDRLVGPLKYGSPGATLARGTMGKLILQPVRFRPGAGGDTFAAEGPGFGVELSAGQVSTVLLHNEAADALSGTRRAAQNIRTERLGMTLVGAHDGAPGRLLAKSATQSNYFLGQDAAAWRMGVPGFERLQFDGVYPGIDVVYYGNGERLEHDFVLAPGSRPESIRLRFSGERPNVAENGDLVLGGYAGELRLLKPVAYQTMDGGRRDVPVRYIVESNGDVELAVGSYDHSQTLVIDPTLAYASYFGSYSTIINGMALDSSGNIFVTGQTYAGFGLATKGATLSTGGGTYDAFLAKLDPTGSNVLFAAYIGGNGVDAATGVALDPSGNAYITGITNSTTFPTVNAYQGTFGVTSCYSSSIVCFNGFVTAVKSDGSALIYSTYLGGSTNDQANAIAVDANGDAYVTGYAQSANFPMLNAYQGAFNNGTTCGTVGNCQDAFVTKFSSTGALVFSTYLGKTGINSGNGIALDSSANIYLTGLGNTDFPQANKLIFNGGTLTASSGTFVAEMAANGTSLLYSDIVAFGIGDAITVDGSGAAYVTGFMNGGTNLPVTAGAYSSTPANVFAFKVAPGGGSLAYSTYIGGTNDSSERHQGTAIAVDSTGDAWIAGFTESNNFPTVSPLQASGGGLFALSTDGGATFAVANTGLLSSAPTAFLLDPNHAGLLLVGQYSSSLTACQSASSASCGGLFTSTNAGATWTPLAASGLTDVRIIALVRTASNAATLYALTPSGMFRSQDDGATWTLRAGTGLPVLNGTSLTLATDPVNAAIVYFSQASVGAPKVWMTSDGGATWASVSTGLPVSGNISFLLSDPVTTGTLYAGIGNKVYKTMNGGTAWTLPNATGVGSQLTALSLDPEVPTTIYAGTQGGYRKSTDGGVTFTAGNSQFSIYSTGITVDPTNSMTLYARRLDTGYWAIYKSTDGGTTFAITPVVNSNPTSITIDPSNNNNLYVLTIPTATAFLTELKPDGTGLLFSTFYGGVGHTRFEAVAVDVSGNAFAAGFSDSSSLVTTNSGGRPSVSVSGVHPMGGSTGDGTTPKNVKGTKPPGGTDEDGTPTGTVVGFKTFTPAVATLSVTVDAPATAGVNTSFSVTVTITNTGNATALAPRLSLSLDPALRLKQLNCPPVTSASTCSLDSIAPKTSMIVKALFIGVKADDQTPVSFTFTATATQPDSTSDSATGNIVIVPLKADLAVVKAEAYAYAAARSVDFVYANNIIKDQLSSPVKTTILLTFDNGDSVSADGGVLAPGESDRSSVLLSSARFSGATKITITVSAPAGVDDPFPLNNSLTIDLPATSTPRTQHTWIVNTAGTLTSADATVTPHIKYPVGTAHTVIPHTGPSTGTSIATDNSGNLWVPGVGFVAEYDAMGAVISSGYTGGGLGGAGNATTAIAIDGSGAAWIANSNGSLTLLNSTGTALSPSTGFTGGGLNAPSGIAVDNAGTVWISNSGNNSVTRVFGVATPTVTPLSTGVYNGSIASVP